MSDAATPTPTPQPQSPPPAAATPAAALKPAAAAPKPKVAIPDPVFNDKHGRLLHKTRLWPTELFPNPWASKSYRTGAALLAGLIIGILATGAILGELRRWADTLYALIPLAMNWAASTGLGKLLRLPPATPFLVDFTWIAIKSLIVLHVVLINGLWAIWWERKISAHIQSRVGPIYAGSPKGWNFHGWAQTALDGVKLLLKEDITPAAADKWVHALAPAIVVIPVIIAFAPVSFGAQLAAADLDIGLLYIFAFSGISVLGVVMAGWASGNKYSLLGGLRASAQLVSYELPRGFSVVPVVMFAGSLNVSEIAAAQSGYWWGVLPKWYIFYPVVGQLAFAIFLIASVAETNRTPFDIPEAESELVSGFHTEYSGMKWSIFFLAEYGYVLLSSFLLAAFFLGGGASPFPFDRWIPSWIWMLAKAMLMMFVFLWIRWTFPRLRSDQLMDFCWKFLLPWSFANIALAGGALALL